MHNVSLSKIKKPYVCWTREEKSDIAIMTYIIWLEAGDKKISNFTACSIAQDLTFTDENKKKPKNSLMTIAGDLFKYGRMLYNKINEMPNPKLSEYINMSNKADFINSLNYYELNNLSMLLEEQKNKEINKQLIIEKHDKVIAFFKNNLDIFNKSEIKKPKIPVEELNSYIKKAIDSFITNIEQNIAQNVVDELIKRGFIPFK